MVTRNTENWQKALVFYTEGGNQVVSGSSYIYGRLFLCMFLIINYIRWMKQLEASQFSGKF